MPNWCTCEVEISGDEIEIKQLLVKGKAPTQWSSDSEFSLENFIPTPTSGRDSNDWHNDNWGTKWDITPEIDNQGTFVQLKFDSAWSPPVEAFEKISQLYPSLEFKLSFFEPGMDFCGIAKYQNGLQDMQEYSYKERFGFELSLDYDKIKIEDEKFIIPLTMVRYSDEYDFESEKLKSLCTLTIPINMAADDEKVREALGTSITITSDDSIEEELDQKEYEIADFLTENIENLKKAAAHKLLDNSLPVNEKNEADKRKI
jgi:hypothetical protein